MNKEVINRLHAEGLISGVSIAKIRSKEENSLFAVHWEIKTMLYVGVLLLTTGLGILVYKNINTIGHQVILLFIALLCTGCFFYCIKNKFPFSTGIVAAPNSFFDYVLLLACCTFIIFIAYLQSQYNLFGNRFGLALFFPMVLLFFSAYFFDHLGILSMAIVNLAAWLGITVTPLQVLTSNDFNNGSIIYTGVALGVLLLIMAWATSKRDIKKHFEFTYSNFGTHLLFISCLAAMFHFTVFYMIWFFLIAGLIYFFYRKALKDRSFYFILIISLYAYIAVSYVVLILLGKINNHSLAIMYAGFLYFIISAMGLMLFLIRINKKLKHDRI